MSRVTDGPRVARPGRLLSVTIGCYSDYSLTGFFVVLKEFAPMEHLQAFLASNPRMAEEYCFREDAFLAFLIAQGLLMEIDHGELHLGDYSSSDEVRFCP